jgi:two-component system, OmpR family, alkaline phosphatase synthesis response regulator PhoP
MSSEKIVVIEDESDILEVISYNLEREGFKVFSAGDGLKGVQIVRDEGPDLIILDLMLPGIDGIEVCRRLKSDSLTSPIPIMMVTAKGEESDVVLGLGIGADDYITKPFSTKELIARAKAVLRRGPLREERGKGERIVIDDLRIDSARHQVHLGDKPVYFTATEFRLLHFLASHPGRVFTRDQLLSRVIGEDANVIDRNIDVHIRSIRKKLGNSRYLIETIRGVGYRLTDVD